MADRLHLSGRQRDWIDEVSPTWLPARVLITASRSWTDTAIIRTALASVWHPRAVLVSGNALGGDRLCEACWEAWGGGVERHPADWSRGRGAGYARNAEMVWMGADVCLAFIRGDSRGATHTAGLAEAAGIPTRRFRWPPPRPRA